VLYQKGLEYIQCPSPGCEEKIRRVVPLNSRSNKSKMKSSPAPNGIRSLIRAQADVERDYGDDLHGIQPMTAKSQGENEFMGICDHQQFDNGNWDGIPSSTKMDAVMGYIEKWDKKAPADKIIGIFSYFGPTLWFS
jgi:hypothetical protein